MSQTSAFVKKLASNEKVTRDAALESLKKYLTSKSSKQLSVLEMEKLWRGLYFSMWFCDRPKAQERLAESLGQLYSSVISAEAFPYFLEAFCVIMIKEWPSIDKWRVDKYYMLIRRVLRHSFQFLRNNQWSSVKVGKKSVPIVEDFLKVLSETVLSGEKSVPVALPYHFCDIYLDELELVIFESVEDLQSTVDSLDKNDKKYQAKAEELQKKKKKIAADVPIKKLISVFERLSKEALLKNLRQKCKEDVLDDPRLKEWGVVEADVREEKEEVVEEAEDSEDEWKGF